MPSLYFRRAVVVFRSGPAGRQRRRFPSPRIPAAKTATIHAQPRQNWAFAEDNRGVNQGSTKPVRRAQSLLWL
ncbi:hypothetical protein E2C01_064628 [Portunus trituberculatus]|uniref:Uncharacterized protein n=1 Tax=Portunus trituberculatus TaxID=210409 RepID=A0A5B7HCC2_PORTR|nr:hypothetical protein [Portunus trituberculatus]